MKFARIDTIKITDWESFHDVFIEVFGFPAYYGRNMNAWIDCMTYLNEPGSSDLTFKADSGEIIVLDMIDVKAFKSRCPEQYDAIIECSAFVKHRMTERGDPPILALSFYM